MYITRQFLSIQLGIIIILLKSRCAARYACVYNTVFFPPYLTHPLARIRSHPRLTPYLVLWHALRADRDNRKFITPPKTTAPRYVLGRYDKFYGPFLNDARATARHCLLRIIVYGVSIISSLRPKTGFDHVTSTSGFIRYYYYVFLCLIPHKYIYEEDGILHQFYYL